MSAETQAATLWARVTSDVRKALASFTDRKRVINRDGDKLVVVSHDPRATASKTISKLRGVPVDPSDDVLTIQLGGREVAIGALLKPGEVDQASYITGFGGDGSASTASRSDHHHHPVGGSTEGMKIGAGASITLRGQAIGRYAQAADASVAVGQIVKANGYVATAVGWDADAAGEHATAVGYRAKALASRAVAYGWDANAEQNYTVALGPYTHAQAEGAIAIGYHTQTPGARSMAIGWDAYASGDRSFAVGYGADTAGISDYGVLRANTVRIVASNGTQSSLQMVLPDGNVRTLNFNSYGDFLVNGTPVVYRNWVPNNIWTNPNKTLAGGGPWTFRCAPVVSTATQIGVASSGWGVFDSGNRIGANGYTWAYIYIPGWSWGFVVQEALV